MTSSKTTEPATLRWQVSSRCNNGSCVEIARLPDGGVGMRDSKNKNGPVLEFTTAEFQTFIYSIKDGKFDL
ncbi:MULTISPECIES: DUF397 domain-containing protein [Streptosporangium]|uniref:DUF397 domain-containing protein n=1 Tax=Streptosporangium brasiliense TaxID=47480 RepID=A0ABT9QZX8_9ACTN|nr:DUF397 domain-containing protein [Streptosporangium brasiliense]MDP9862508.1 hypothetical protein [Streptosporangium brasiliense]